MADKAKQSGVRLRPHFKTHQSADIGEWFRQYGVQAITVSSVDMAFYFAQHGWRDLTIAFPVNLLEIDRLNQLADQLTLHMLVESPEVVTFLADQLTVAVNIWLKIDVGYQRTGIPAAEIETVMELVDQIEHVPQLTFKGLLTHTGQTYQARGKAAVQTLYDDTINKLKQLQAHLPQAELSIGDTPSCSLVDDLSAVDEIRPGNFIFYDVMQQQIGSCLETDIAVAVACPIVAKHPHRQQVVIYGGAVHLSKEFLLIGDGRRSYGKVATLASTGWSASIPGVYVSAISQEHGIINANDDFIARVEVGDVLVILPVHSCLTVDLMRKYHTLEGDIYETRNHD